jgi:hypothetical protein
MATGTAALKFWQRPIYLRRSVRGLLFLVLAAGIGLGWVLHKAREAKAQRDLVAAIRRAGGGVNYDRHPDEANSYIQEDPWPDWLVKLVGIDALATATQVDDMGCGLDDDALAIIGKFDHLESVVLRNCDKLTDVGLAHLRGKSRLRELVEGDGGYHGPPKFAGVGLGHLEGCTGLERLRIVVGTSLSDADFVRLSNLTELRRLVLHGDGRSTVTDAALAHLAPLRKLRHLEFGGSKDITDEGLMGLGRLTGLESLSLSGPGRITDLRGLGPLVHLKTLTLPSLPGLTDLKGLTPLAGLETLTLWDVPVDDRGFAALAGLRSLRSLDIYRGAALTDAGMVHFRGLGNLEVLYLGGSRITDAGLECLRDCPKLDRLHLDGAPVTDEGLLALVKRKSYHTISLSGTKVTPAGIRSARAILPDSLIQGP